nr:DUF4037 domain-containing protein [uncultured Cellulosilyticum sp.]
MEDIKGLVEAFSKCEEVEGIALGGSRALGNNDAKSDYDIYMYLKEALTMEKRKRILENYCNYMEIGNAYWEEEDDCVLKNGIVIEIIYRKIDEIENDLKSVLEFNQAHNGYTTCIWHNVETCKILYDAKGRLQALKEKYNIPYPEKLRENIIIQNLSLLEGKIPSYNLQIKKAIERGDIVSINHRITEFLASYFDILFALNRQMHPGEKRLISLCEKHCTYLPQNFEVSLKVLLTSQSQPEKIMLVVEQIIKEVKELVAKHL